jgi:hypothetical protein
VASSSEHGNGSSDSIKGGFIDRLSNYQLFRKDSSPAVIVR